MCFFAGNDFLPKIVAFSNIEVSIDLFVRLYNKYIYCKKDENKNRDWNRPKQGFLTKTNSAISWKVLIILLEKFVEKENQLLEHIADDLEKEEKSE